MIKQDNRHIWAGVGFVVVAIVIAGAIYFGTKIGPNSQNSSPSHSEEKNVEPTPIQAGANVDESLPSDANEARTELDQNSSESGKVTLDSTPDSTPMTGESEEPQESSVALAFNAIGPYVNQSAGYVCEGERWALIGADNDVNGNHLIWQGENGDYKKFAYRWNRKLIHLTDLKTGQKTSFPMIHLNSGDWMVNGERLQECAG